ncbi:MULTISPECIES: beta-galactosidase [unclassified Streptomyces]|uniref:beta-galactosidase n=1 Tax=unclassified Streptomyces TaxID=2593676 RepID=UPI00381A59EA
MSRRTSRGTCTGANRSGELNGGGRQPDVTSYDYDAPIDEAGRPTEKFWLFREVFAAYQDVARQEGQLPDVPEPRRVLDALRGCTGCPSRSRGRATPGSPCPPGPGASSG